MSKFYKTVLLPIQVCKGDYCWDGKGVCGYFDNYGGHAHCDLDIGICDRDKEGFYPKPKECLELEERKNVSKK